MKIVRKILTAIEEDATSPMYYTVATYVEGDPGEPRATGFYRKLTWTEAVDVVLVLHDENRPGMKPTEDGVQQGLW